MGDAEVQEVMCAISSNEPVVPRGERLLLEGPAERGQDYSCVAFYEIRTQWVGCGFFPHPRFTT